MVKKLISRTEFAALAGVSPAAVTKALRSGLKGAATGKRVDISAPCAVKYLEDKAAAQTEPPATGIDPLYEKSIEYCRSTGKIVRAALMREFKIADTRAKRIVETMRVNGVDVTKDEPKKPVHRGTSAIKVAKKAASLENLKTSVVTDVDSGHTIHEIPEDIKAFADMTLRELIQRFGTDVAFVDWLKATKSIEDINEKRLKNAATKGELVSRDLIKKGVFEPIDTLFINLLTDGAKTIAQRMGAMVSAGRSTGDCEKFVSERISKFINPVKTKIARSLKNA